MTTDTAPATATRSPKPATRRGRDTAASSAVAQVRTRRPWPWTAGAIALIVVGGLISAAVWSSSANVSPVFIAGSDLQRGDIIERGDLSTLNLAAGTPSAAYTLDQVDNLVGQTAAVDLPAGSLLTPSTVTESLEIPRGQAIVGVSLSPNQMPATPLVAGDSVQIVTVAAVGAVPGVAGDTAIDPVPATVAATTFDEIANQTIVDVYVAENLAASLTSRAAAGTVALYFNPTEGE